MMIYGLRWWGARRFGDVREIIGSVVRNMRAPSAWKERREEAAVRSEKKDAEHS